MNVPDDGELPVDDGLFVTKAKVKFAVCGKSIWRSCRL
jgi:hypothetical protein